MLPGMTSDSADRPRVRQLRLVVTAEDYEAALAFYRDALGLREEEAYQGDDGARVTILDAGRATLELSNPAQVRMIDAVETEGSPSARIRVAFEVDDSATVTNDLVRGEAELVASPRETPWRSLNARLEAPAGLQITVFQELGPAGPDAAGPDAARPDAAGPDAARPDAAGPDAGRGNPADMIGDGAA
jgi:catechol 2,3-dioxygenase-like lactoylglutathione lyase family enzyme